MQEDTVGEATAESTLSTETDDADASDREHNETDPVLGTPSSSKEPTQQQKRTKRLRIETKEEELMQKALTCMEKATVGHVREDGLELFGRYVASELRAIPDPQDQSWAKLQIQNILYNAQMETPRVQLQPAHFSYMDARHFSSAQQGFQFSDSGRRTRTPSLSPAPSSVAFSTISDPSDL